jgi:acetyl esterase
VHEIRDLEAGGIPARLYRPRAGDGLGLLVFLHGGGWVIGDLDSHDNVCRALANGSGHAVLSVEYRLAPEFPFPAGLDDAVAATRWAHANAPSLGCRADRLAIGGDSAGANLAAVVAQLAPEFPFPAGLDDAISATRWAHANAASLGCRADRLAIGGDSAGGNLAAVVAQQAPVPLVFQLLVYPVTDCSRSHPSHVDNAEGYFLSSVGMQWFIDHYIESSGVDPRDPRVSPLFGTDTAIAATPPALVVTAEFDPLRDEGDAYAAKLAACGVATSHVRFGGMFHGFFSLADFLDDAKMANALAAAAVKAALDR